MVLTICLSIHQCLCMHTDHTRTHSFDEGIASRVPYESAARVLPQSKRSFAGYTVRQGLAIAMEHSKFE